MIIDKSIKKKSLYFKGIPASPGIAIGKVLLVERNIPVPEVHPLQPEEIEPEVEKFKDAVKKSADYISDLRNKALTSLNEPSQASIFDAHLVMLEDPLLIDRTINRVKEEHLNAATIFYENLCDLIENLRKIENSFFRMRCSDLEEVGHLILSNLKEQPDDSSLSLSPDTIVVAHDLGPGETVRMSHQMVGGFAIDVGGPTSHTAIMAKALEIPAIVAASNLSHSAKLGDTIIIDGEDGTIILNPGDQEIAEYQTRRNLYEERQKELAFFRELPAETLDGQKIELAANIEIIEEIPHVKEHGAEGIGLFRTEYLYVNHPHLPSEEELFLIYRKVAEAMNPRPVIYRTIDVGGDKFVSSIPIPQELNPFLGLRAIRLYREFPNIFRQQLRAIIRASAFGNVKIMFPMVCQMEEVVFAIETMRQEMAALEFNGIPFNPEIETGIMIETPSAAIISDILAKKVNFFSIGTNDLIQYTLAVDRNNERVAYLYEPFHPSVLRLIKSIIDCAHKNNIWVGVCGEMAGDPYAAVILLGLGIDELSTGAINIPAVKRMIRSVNYRDLKELSLELLECNCASEVKEQITRAVHRLYIPDSWR